MTMTQDEAIKQINLTLREERTGYTFETARDYFQREYFERTGVVSFPGQAEIPFALPVIAIALHGEDSTVGRLANRRLERGEVR